MRVNEIMSREPACCTPETTLDEAAKKMLERNCGCLPVCDGPHVVGVITDRDITVRAVAAQRDPATSKVSDFMSHPVASISDEATIEECCTLMEQNQVRRIPIVNSQGVCCGMVSQADIALARPGEEVAGLLQTISQPDTGIALL